MRIFKIVSLSIAIAVSTLVTGGFAQDQQPGEAETQEIPKEIQKHLDRIEKSVVKMKIYIDGELVGHGTGWYVAEDRIVTNYHMIQAFLDFPGTVAVKAQFKGGSEEYPITEMLSYDQHNDAVVLIASKKAEPLALASKDLELENGQRLFFTGNPGSNEFVTRFGPIASTAKKFDEPLGVRTNLEVEIVTGGGASGSPVFNEKGEVVSMIMGGADGVVSGLCLDPPTLVAVLEAADSAEPQKIEDYAKAFIKTLGEPGEIVTSADGQLRCTARKAETHGNEIQFETESDIRGNIGYWLSSDDWLSWNVDVPAAGEYNAVLVSACPEDTAGTEMSFEVLKAEGDDAKTQLATFTVEATGDFMNYEEHVIGTVTLEAGEQRLAVKPLDMSGFAVMNLQRIVLTPVDADTKKEESGKGK